MKLSIEFNTLMSIMNQINKIAKRNKYGLIQSRIQLKAAANSMIIVATDQDQTLQMNADCMVESDGVAFVDGVRLYTVLSKMKKRGKDSVVCFTLDSDAKKLTIALGAFESDFENYADQESILYDGAFSQYEFDGAFMLRMNQFRRFFSLCSHCISTEETRYYLGGVYFHKDKDGKLAAVATDGHKLALIKDELPSGADKIMPKKGLIIPRAAVNDLLELFGKKATDDYPITFEFCEKRVKFTCADFTFLTCVIDGSFPDYPRVLPKNPPHWFDGDSEEFLMAVESLAALSQEGSRAIKIDVKSRARVEFSITTPDGVNGRDLVKAEVGDEFHKIIKTAPFQIGFNAAYLIEMFGIDKKARVEMGFNTNSDPAEIRISSDENAMWVLMPMRV